MRRLCPAQHARYAARTFARRMGHPFVRVVGAVREHRGWQVWVDTGAIKPRPGIVVVDRRGAVLAADFIAGRDA